MARAILMQIHFFDPIRHVSLITCLHVVPYAHNVETWSQSEFGALPYEMLLQSWHCVRNAKSSAPIQPPSTLLYATAIVWQLLQQWWTHVYNMVLLLTNIILCFDVCVSVMCPLRVADSE